MAVSVCTCVLQIYPESIHIHVVISKVTQELSVFLKPSKTKVDLNLIFFKCEQFRKVGNFRFLSDTMYVSQLVSQPLHSQYHH